MKIDVREDGKMSDKMQKHTGQMGGNNKSMMSKGAADMTGYIIRNEILSAYCVIHSNAPPIQYCYSIQLLLNPSFYCAVVTTLTHKTLRPWLKFSIK